MKSEIVPLTSLRFFAAFFVYLFHVRAMVFPDIDSYTQFFSSGALWVDFFFILSGFVLSYNYSETKWNRPSYRKFLLARLGRVYPVHLVTMLAAIAMYVIASKLGIYQPADDDKSSSLATVPAQLLLIHAWGVHDFKSLNEPSWSISAEWLAYLLVPVFFGVSRLLRNRIIIVLAATVSYAAFASSIESLHGLTYYGALRIVPSFFIGVCIHRLINIDSSMNSSAAVYPLLVGTVMVLHYGAHPSIVIAIFSLLIWSIAQASVGQAKAEFWPLSSRVLHYGGKISYSLYMCHGLILMVQIAVLNLVGKLPGSGEAIVVGFVFLCVTLAASSALYHLVEEPGRKSTSRLAKHLNN